MGGGNPFVLVESGFADGLSPRGRGKRIGSIPAWAGERSIPAWAGETPIKYRRACWQPVYPRVGGGNIELPPLPEAFEGLSPRGRGKHWDKYCAGGGGGSIPAWAGETRAQAPAANRLEVYPRVGGGNGQSSRPPCRRTGLSPRGRGKPMIILPPPSPVRSIPAWAGETRHPSVFASVTTVYPRVGGGNASRSARCSSSFGLSPRGRGKLHAFGASDSRPRSIPAWAGETYANTLPRPTHRVYPRVGGGNEIRIQRHACICGLSPRGRGKRRTTRSCMRPPRSIPAWAGETVR